MMEIKEEIEDNEEKFNLMDLISSESSKGNYVLYGEKIQASSPSELSTLYPVPFRALQQQHSDIGNAHGLKEMKVILKRVILPRTKIKQEIIIEDDNSYLDSLEDDNMSLDNNSHLKANAVENAQETNVYNEEVNNNQCQSCNYVFGIASSFADHKKTCNESSAICKAIVESVIDAAVGENSGNVNEAVERCSLPFRFVCCGTIFTTFIEFNSHKFSKHEIGYLICGLCKYKVGIAQNLYRHYKESHFPEINILIDNKVNGLKKTTLVKPCVKEADCYSNVGVCSAVQQGILCQCSYCSSKHSKKDDSTSSDSKRFICTICGLRFYYRAKLTAHEKTHSGIKPFPCDICAKSFTKRTGLEHHKLSQHSSEKSPFSVTCNICSKQLSCKGALNRHVRNIHLQQSKADNRISCPYCPKTLADSKSLSRHVKKHLQESEYICADCNRVFYTKENLLSHIKSQHLPKVKIKCDMCGYMATNSANLCLHKAKKHLTWRFNCEICGKTFALKNSLENHRVMHFDEKPFVCRTCGKGFKREANLEQHMHSHSTARPHLCAVCGLSFRLRTHVKQHMAVHGIGNNHKCIICHKGFARKSELKVHMTDHDLAKSESD